MNNYERIKNMTVDEMAEILHEFNLCYSCPATLSCGIDKSCKESIEQWLQKECEKC